MRVALYFGSFNPIHKGHTAIADYLIDSDIVDELWLIVSPHNPLKESWELAHEQHRLEMTTLAANKTRNSHKILVRDFEFQLPQPSYTINSLEWLQSHYPSYEFMLVIGEDNLLVFDKWRDWQRILSEFKILVYPRTGYLDTRFSPHTNITKLPLAPLADISSTQLREIILRGDTSEWICSEVMRYIIMNKLYRQ